MRLLPFDSEPSDSDGAASRPVSSMSYSPRSMFISSWNTSSSGSGQFHEADSDFRGDEFELRSGACVLGSLWKRLRTGSCGSGGTGMGLACLWDEKWFLLI